MSEIKKLEGREGHFLEATFQTTFQNAKSRIQNGESLVSETFTLGDMPWNISLNFNPSHGTLCYLKCLEMKPGFSGKLDYKFSISTSESDQPFEIKGTTAFNEIGGYWGLIPCGGITKISKGIPYSSLTLKVTLRAELPLNSFQPGRGSQSLQPPTIHALINDMNVVFESGDGDADVTFKLKDGSVIKAHKGILSVRNAVFATMLSVDMKEAKTKEVILDDIGKRALKVLLFHIYTGHLWLPEELDVESCKEIVNGAEKYNLPELKEVAGMALAEFCSVTNALQLFTFCRDHNVKRLKESN